ncbi:MAG: type 1 glutamine amidotransferase domain-containing protein [Pseudomonadota bacterium]
MTKKILMVLTSHDRLGETGKKTGYWLEELAAPYYAFRDAGLEVTLASPKGGRSPADPGSEAEDSQTAETRRFTADAAAQAQLDATLPLAEVEAGDYDAIFYPGGHGPLWDLVEDAQSIALIEAFWAQDKVVGAVCHAPIVLANAKDPAGEPIVKGRRVTAFTNAEEAAVGLTEAVPHLVEDVLTERGALFDSAGLFEPKAHADGRLVTGQNPPSSTRTALLVLDALGVAKAA